MYPILLISGTPGCGKSTFARWLVAHRGFTHADLENGGFERLGLADQLSRFFDHHDVDPLMQGLVACPNPVVFDWGYPPILWPRVAQLVSAGVSAWWFEADRLAARAQFTARATVPLWAFDNQCSQIAAAWNEIAALYPDRIVRNLSAAGCFEDPERVASVILGAV